MARMIAKTVHDFRELINAALEYSSDKSYTFEDIAAAVERDEMQFWHTENSVVITQIAALPQRTWLHVLVSGGNLAELRAASETIAAWAKANGCTHASLVGRPGWERTFLTQTGWRKSRLVVMEREL